jgi:hypothetical protein
MSSDKELAEANSSGQRDGAAGEYEGTLLSWRSADEHKVYDKAFNDSRTETERQSNK